MKDSTIALVLACVAYLIGFIHGMVAMLTANWDDIYPEPDGDDDPFDDDPDGPDPLKAEADTPSITLHANGDIVIDELDSYLKPQPIKEPATVMSDFYQAGGLYFDVSYEEAVKIYDF